MNIIKLLEGSDPLIAAAELNERIPGKVQNIHIIATQSLDQRRNAGDTVNCPAMFLAHLL